MTTIPPTPKPGEVWENDEGKRRFVCTIDRNKWICGASPNRTMPIDYSPDEWRDWASRTNARVILPARGDERTGQ